MSSLIQSNLTSDLDEFISKNLGIPQGIEVPFDQLIQLIEAASCTGSNRVDEIVKHFKVDKYTYAELSIINSYLVIDYWLNWNVSALNKLFTSSVGRSAEELQIEDGAHAQAHMNICARLMMFRLNNQGFYAKASASNPILVIGDSHTLCMQGVGLNWNGVLRTLKAIPIRGVKMHHLSSGNPLKYRQYFHSILKKTPIDSEIFISIGEIDSRPNMGIFLQAFKSGMANLKGFELVTRATVDGFIKYIRSELNALERREDQVTIIGIPPIGYPIRKDLPKGATEKQFLYVNSKINSTMREIALLNGIKYIDLQMGSSKLTKPELQICRLDNFHLTPQFYEKLGSWVMHP